VTINDAGITIGGPGTLQISIESSGMSVRTDRDATYRVGQNFRLDASSNVQIKGGGTTDVSGAGAASFTGSRVSLGCANAAKPAARLGDQVNTSTGPVAMIAQGSQTVLIC
jgi:phage gp45-like